MCLLSFRDPMTLEMNMCLGWVFIVEGFEMPAMNKYSRKHASRTPDASG